MRLLVAILGRPLESFDEPRPAHAIVVLGALLRSDSQLSPAAEERVQAGISAWRAGLAPRLCFSGGRSPIASHAATEAAAMAEAARAAGIPESAILVEDSARSTFENARRCAELLHPQGARVVWLVTQPFHMRRAKRHFRRAGFVPLGYRIDDSLQSRDLRWGLARVFWEYVSWAKTLLLWR